MNYYDEEERRKLNELLSKGAISSNGMIDGIPNQTLAALMADNSEPSVQFAQPQFQQGEMDRNREQFAREEVRAMERGYNPQQYQTPQAPVQPQQPAAPQPQNWIQKGNGEKISLDQFAQPAPSGNEILGRQRTPDGGEVIIKRVMGLDGFGRQTARVVQEFVPPPDLGRMKQTAEIQKLQAETEKVRRGEVPKAPEGYRFTQTGDVEPIPGSKAAREAQAAIGKEQQGREYALSGMTQLEEALAALAGTTKENLPNVFTKPDALKSRLGPAAGAIQGRVPFANVNWEQESNVRSQIAQLQNLAQTYGLSELKAAGVSPGSITEKEWPKFAARLANLDLTQSEDVLVEQLRKVYNDTLKARTELRSEMEGTLAPQGVAVPESAITYLRNNPQLKGQFEAKYGAGSAAAYIGR